MRYSALSKIFCRSECVFFSLDPSQPSNGTVYVDITQINVTWKSPGNVMSYNITAQCSCECNPSVTNFGTNTSAFVTGLEPGTYCNVTIIAESGGLYSIPLVYYKIETNDTGRTYFYHFQNT